MSRTIWKFPLKMALRQDVAMPLGAEILSVQLQAENVCIWALVDDSATTEICRIDCLPTGGQAPQSGANFIGTVQIDWTVWHFFQSKESSHGK